MSVGSKLHAIEIDCLVSRIVNGVRRLEVFACDELLDVTREIRLWCFILNTDPNSRQKLTGSHFMYLSLVALNYLIHLVFILACIV